MQNIKVLLSRRMREIEVQLQPKWLREGFFIKLNRVQVSTKVSPTAKLLFDSLVMHGFQKASCRVSHATLAREIPCARYTVIRKLKELEKNGWISCKRRTGQPTIYIIAVDKLRT